jgi:hypothetical protein
VKANNNNHPSSKFLEEEILKKVPLIFLVISLIVCGCTSVKSGPVLGAGPIQVGLFLNSTGELEIETTVSIPVVEDKDLGFGLNWDTTFSTIINQMTDKTNYLVVLWESENGDIHEQDYPIGQSFEVTFEHDQWVSKIQHIQGGNIVVFVELNKFPSQEEATQIPATEFSSTTTIESSPTVDLSMICPPTRLQLGGSTYIPEPNFIEAYDNPPPYSSNSITLHYDANLGPEPDAPISYNVVDGPLCIDGNIWWKIQSDRPVWPYGENPIGRTASIIGGWVIEGRYNYYGVDGGWKPYYNLESGTSP